MPLYRRVPSLKKLSLKGLAALLVPRPANLKDDVHMYDYVQDLMNAIPHNLYDTMAEEILNLIKDYLEEHEMTENLSSLEINILLKISEIVLNNKLHTFDFSTWPETMTEVIYNILPTLTGLESFKCDSRILDDVYFAKALSSMKNLTLIRISDCTDYILKEISESCKNIQYLDLTFSTLVTDYCVEYVCKMSKLKKLLLSRTYVSVEGIAEILKSLPNIQYVECDDFGELLKYILQSRDNIVYGLRRTKQLSARKSSSLSDEDLKRMVKMLPKLEHLGISFNNDADVKALSSLDNLNEIQLSKCVVPKQLFEVIGSKIQSVELEGVYNLNLEDFIAIGECCPRIKVLSCVFSYFEKDVFNNVSVFKKQPFQELETVTFVSQYASLPSLEYVLINACNIKCVKITSIEDIPHSFIDNILQKNPMKQLQIFKVHGSKHLNMDTVKLLLENCPNLKVLSQLRYWVGISENELCEFKEYVSSNNFDLECQNWS